MNRSILFRKREHLEDVFVEYLTAFFYRQTIITLVTKRIAPESCCYDIGLHQSLLKVAP